MDNKRSVVSIIEKKVQIAHSASFRTGTILADRRAQIAVPLFIFLAVLIIYNMLSD